MGRIHDTVARIAATTTRAPPVAANQGPYFAPLGARQDVWPSGTPSTSLPSIVPKLRWKHKSNGSCQESAERQDPQCPCPEESRVRGPGGLGFSRRARRNHASRGGCCWSRSSVRSRVWPWARPSLERAHDPVALPLHDEAFVVLYAEKAQPSRLAAIGHDYLMGVGHIGLAPNPAFLPHQRQVGRKGARRIDRLRVEPGDQPVQGPPRAISWRSVLSRLRFLIVSASHQTTLIRSSQKTHRKTRIFRPHPIWQPALGLFYSRFFWPLPFASSNSPTKCAPCCLHSRILTPPRLRPLPAGSRPGPARLRYRPDPPRKSPLLPLLPLFPPVGSPLQAPFRSLL